MYNDKLKLALMSKFHLNHLLKSNIRLAFPFIMIMGFGFFFYCLDFENGMYVIKEIDKCCFPISKNYISQKGILDLFDCINNVKSYLVYLKDRKEEVKKNLLHKKESRVNQV
ncbi:hypothetical protein EDC94DRAFT_625239 [Helicostylum pulchrum]|nr:hypothetical protein EDC94DRAFT_625239 [Helicostylum pulchrum]